MASLIRRYFKSIDKETGQPTRTMAQKWYGQYLETIIDAGGNQQQKLRRIPLDANKGKAKAMLNEIVHKMERKLAMAKAGIVNPFEDHAKRPLLCHLDDWEKVLKARDNTDEYVALKIARAKKIITACKFKVIADFSASRVEGCLADMRKDSPRCGTQTSNHYLGAIKQFARWLVKDRRAAESVLAHLDGGNVELDRRHDRRDLSDAELLYLFASTRRARSIRRISGRDREMLYLTAVYTGLRASELHSLKSASFDLDAATPTATVEAAYSKHRRQDVVPLHAELVRRLRPWLAGIPPARLLWPGKWAKHKEAGVILKTDLREARKAWIEAAGDDEAERKRREESSFLAYRDESGQCVDFHALRHTMITRLVKAGVKPKDAQALARHSTITLTMDRYAHVGLHDTATAMEQVPAVGPVTGTGREAMRATGTDGGLVSNPCTNLALESDTGRQNAGSLPVSTMPAAEDGEGSQIHAPTRGDRDLQGGKAEREGFEPSVGFHPHRFSRPARSATLSPLRLI